MIKLARKYHRWLLAFTGIQFLFWSVTGLYMVSIDIHHIHGETLKRTDAHNQVALSRFTYPLEQVTQRYPDAREIAFVNVLNEPVYRVIDTSVKPARFLISAISGEPFPQISEQDAIHIAQQNIAGDYRVSGVRLINDYVDMPDELAPGHLPVWQVSFEHFTAPTFYISQYTGDIVTTRHLPWRLFDWMWRFHIMDYDDGENISNPLLFILALFGALGAIAGIVLTYFRIARPQTEVTSA